MKIDNIKKNRIYKFISDNYSSLILLVLCMFLFKTLISIEFVKESNLLALARSFIEGRIYLKEPLATYGDLSFYNGRFYLYLGPFPSIILIPFVLLGINLSQQLVAITLGVFAFIAIVKIARKFSLSINDALFIAIAFQFGSVFLYTTAVNITTLQVQSISNSLLILALFEFIYKRRWLLIGVLLSCSFATRLTILPAVLFFLYYTFKEREHKIIIPKSVFLLFIPIFITLSLLLIYNFARFGNYFETGYKYNTYFGVTPNHLAAEKYGLFSLKHIPVNLYHFIYRGPEMFSNNIGDLTIEKPYLKANGLGMSILFTSPIVIYLINLSIRKKYVIISLITSLFIFMPSLLYFGIGNSQFGYRYALDFYPFLLLLLLTVFQKEGVPKFAKLLIIYSVLFNSYFLYSIWGIYPF